MGDYGILSYAGDLVDAISTSLSETSPVAEEDVVLKPGSPLGGVVLDPAGQPVEGATVLPYQFSVLGEEILPHEPTAVIRQATNAEGGFRFPRLWPGKWKLFVLAEGYAPTVTDFIRHKTTDAVIRLSNSLQAHGTVIHADTGEPLAGVHFVARNKHCARDAHEVVSGEGGAFTLEGLAAGEYQIDVNDPSMIAGRDPLVLEGGSATPVEIPVRQGGILTGRVYDQETGEGIGGIEMYVAYKGEIVTDPLGNFIATGLPPANIYVQVGESPGYSADDQTRSREIMMPAGGEMQVDFALRKGVPVAGVVTDAQGEPVVGARVSIQGGSSNWWYASAKTGPGGRFLCQEALPGKVSVEASKDNLYSRRKMDVVVEEAGLEGLNLVLDLVADAGMKGRISTANPSVSEANTNMEISLNPVDPSLPRRNGRVDLIGRFNITAIVPGEYDVMIETQSGMYSQCMAERLTLKPGELVEGLELGCKDQGTLTIAGRVVDSNRQPIEGARIQAPQAPMGQATTGPDGRFTLRGLHEGEFGLSVMHENYGTQSFNDLEAGAQDLEIVLQRRSTVSGRVIDAQTRQPIPAFEVAWSQGITDRIDYWPGTATPVSNVKGEYSLDKVEPDGTIAVYARASGYATGRAAVEVPADATVNGVEIALNRGVKVRGTVVNAEGAPVSAVKIFIDNKPMQPEYESPATMTDVNGQFLLENLPAESVTLTAWTPDYAMASVEAPAGGGDVSILLGRGGSIEGRVFIDGAPASWYSVTLKDDSDHDQYVQLGDLQAGLDGTFKVEHLPPGRLVVAVALMQPMEEQPNSYAHIRTQVVPVAVENDRATPVEVYFRSDRGNLHGRVSLEGEPATGFTVQLVLQTASGEAVFYGTELPGGYFTLPDLPMGTGEVIVTLLDYPLERRTEVEIGDGGDRQVHVSFYLTELNQPPATAVDTGLVPGFE